jgi:hypothetical protein
MSDTPDFGFGKFVPGFDFLQGLAKGASGGIPQMPPLANWVAPTISVEELEKRVAELKAVQFWLEQNSRALTATIQALEVQKMTLATLKGMNVSMGDVANAFKFNPADAMMGNLQKAGESMAGAAQAMAGAAPARASEKAPPEPPPEAAPQSSKEKAPDGASASVVDPMQWWGALTQQFQQIAAHALKDDAMQAALDSTKNMATGLVKEAFKTATGMGNPMAAKSAPNRSTAPRRSPKAAPAAAPAAKKAASKKAAPRKAAPRKAPAKPVAQKSAARRPASRSAR